MNQNFEDELDLLNKEEEILSKIKNDLNSKESESNSLNESQSSKSMTPIAEKLKSNINNNSERSLKATTEVSPFSNKTKESKAKIKPAAKSKKK